MTRRMALVRRACIALALVGVALPLGAQPVPEHPSLDARSRDELRALIRAAEDGGLPSRTLTSRIDEGLARGAPAPRIVAVVRAHLEALRSSRRALGERSTEAELEAGASALRAGLADDELREVRRHRPAGTATTALVVWTDLRSRQLPQASTTALMKRALPLAESDRVLLDVQRALASATEEGGSAAAERSIERILREVEARHPVPSARKVP